MDAASIDALRRRLQSETGRPVALVETHISWVLLTERLAYKVKKPVRLPFVDFSTLALRRHYCEEELRLNRRLAPALYLRVAPVGGTAQAPCLDAPGEPIDHAVCMRRFAAGALLSERLAGGTLVPDDLERLAAGLAEFHRITPTAVFAQADADPTGRVLQPIRAVLRQLRADGDAARIVALDAWVTAQAHALRDTWGARQRDGRVRECHGDLHLGNVAMIDGVATPFDCIEFDPALRCIDVLSDVAFLTMDLKAHGRDDLASGFLDAYLQHSGDYDGVPVLAFYEAYRALVRALAARLSPHREAAGPDYLALAERIAQQRGAPRLLITCGVSGSGKSTIARRLLALTGAIRLRSDVERKRLFGLPALARTSDPARVYGPDATRRTFDRLAQGARAALRAGYPVIVDAAFLRRAEREAFRALAAELGVPFTILHCRAAAAQLRERVARRSATRRDASEADLAVLERQLDSGEPPGADERPHVIELTTDAAAEVDAAALRDRWLALPRPAPDPAPDGAGSGA